MATQTATLYFKDLIDFSDENVHEAIPISRAVQVTLDAYKVQEIPDCEIYKCWATSLFQRYGPSTISESDLNQLFNIFSSTIEKLLNECKECVSESQSGKLIAFLNYSLELFTWIRSVATDFDTNEVTVLLCFGLSVINNYLIAFSRPSSCLNANKLLEKSLGIQAVILGILSENPKTFCFDNGNGFLLNNLVSHLCAVGEVTPKLDIKTTVDTWKSISKLASQNAAQTQSEGNSIIGPVWLKEPLTFLVNEIGRNIQTAYKKNSLSEPIQQVQKYLKVTNFYLRLLQKIIIDFQYVPFPVCEDFLNTYALLLSPPGYIVNTPVHNVIIEYITKDFKELIPFVYRSDLFFKHLLSEHIGKPNINEVFYEIVLDVIEVVVQRNESEYLKPQLLDAAFERFSSSTHIFVSTSIYNHFIETLSSLQIRFHLELVEQKLVYSILQNEAMLALAAIDIWCTIFRAANRSDRLTYFEFWKNINESFSTFSNCLPALYVEVLLKNLYSYLTITEKDEIWDKFNALTLNSDRFLLAIGLNNIPNVSVRQSITQHFLNELIRFLTVSSNAITVDNFYTIVKDLKLLAPVEFRNDELIDMLLRFLDIAMKNEKLSLLLISILDFITSKLESIDDRRLLKILTELSMEVSKFGDHSIKLCVVEFLRRISKMPRLTKHSEKILKIIESDKFIKHLGNLNSIANDRVSLEKNENALQEILKKASVGKVKCTHTHICLNEEETRQNKKIKTHTTVLLESLENNVNELQSLGELKQLSSSDIEIVKRVTRKLQQVGSFS